MGEEELRQRDRMVELRAQIINLLQDAWELGYECGAKDISSARTVTLDAMTDAELAERGLMRLPVDADGVTWTGEEQYAKFKGCSEFHIGDKVIRKNGRIGTVIGFAIGKDNRHCLVLSMHDGHWRTYLCPIDEARLLKVPTPAQVRTLIMGAIQSAASGDNYNAETAERKADYIMDVAHACFCGEPFPIGGAK
jgi:hypothetical protein